MTSKNNKTLATVGIIMSIALGLNAFGLLTSKSDIQDTVNTIISKEIEKNDDLDDAKYFDKDDGVTMQADVKHIKEDVKETKANVKEIGNKINQILILIQAKDSL